MCPLSGALPLPYVPACVTRGFGCSKAFVCGSSLWNLSVPQDLWSDLCNPVFDGVRLAGFKSRVFFISGFLSLCLQFFFSVSSFHVLVMWGWGPRIDRESSLSPGLAVPTLF